MNDPIGGVRLAPGDIALSPDRPRLQLSVTNTSRRVVRVSSHFPFWRSNHRLQFDRETARGYHLDIPAGSVTRWAPSETRAVALVRFGGEGSA
jgi:urease beta subunit